MKIVNINKEIFREYDIRGIYKKDLDEDVAYTIGISFGSYVKLNGNNIVIVGHDNRESGPELSNGLITGLRTSGVDVIDLGLVTTPMYYYAKKKNNIEAGIMITASHNPREYNGFKIAFDKRGNACGKEITDYYDFIIKGNFSIVNGNLTHLNIENDYLKLIKNSINLGNRKIKVVYDCGNGTGSIIVKKMLDLFNIEYDLLYCESDPTFPNHHPDPCVHENMQDLAKRVKELNYDLGIGIDGDADRVGLVDQNGNIISTDLIMVIVYRYLSDKITDKRALYDVKCSKALIDELDKLGYQHVMNRTGNSYQNRAINEGHYLFGGEYSGHLWFNDKFPGFDDGIYAGLRLIEILSNSDKKTSELLDGINKYYSTEELKIHADDSIKFSIVDEVKKYCKDKNYNIIDIDGVRAQFDDSWALVRCSNTGPNITVRFEAKQEDRLEEIKEEFLNKIDEIKRRF